MIQSKETVSAVSWGQGCKAWALHADDTLSVKHEEMPSGTCEVRHYHEQAQQFFFVLAGVLVLEVAGQRHLLRSQNGLAIAPKAPHQAINDSSEPVEFLVISTPPTDGDRVEADAV